MFRSATTEICSDLLEIEIAQPSKGDKSCSPMQKLYPVPKKGVAMRTPLMKER